MNEKQTILPGQTIGILGGGQLGRMMAIAAKEMGYRTAVMEPASDSPCGQVSDTEVIAAYADREGAASLAAVSDVLTFEFENIDGETAEHLADTMYLPQGGNLLQITQDRKKEKEAIEALNIPVAPWAYIETKEDLKSALTTLGVPSVLKTTRGGYDGKGQAVLKDMSDADMAFEGLAGKGPFVLEAFIDFELEISVIVTRGTNGDIATFPVAENIHVNNILHQSIVPARLPQDGQAKAIDLARTLAEKLDMIGTLAVEMFVTTDGEMYVNELAPRPHNSGHYTLNACNISQFGQHVRAICGLPLIHPVLLKPVVMVNLLGEHMEAALQQMTVKAEAHWHLYGKAEARSGRKMGHVNILTDDLADTIEDLETWGIW
ncbi:5-(carboxyamino)imidazole ribonucleotide synthase [Salisediminibacterium beveridgei]|uniref:N5-carboxyaminoimidazole ribonucleotide synthase n=1 Tax=Salisediminibacterium beveridgei TaxID=632773 RepID=A0A1D7QYB4_9BACI|nr:5-(carboxyamino)imidazole ribonucleotide synthase [Salisediminibacterium beveridgei]AOM83968.1 Phosphoribosylaminoimidazole carboxylase ATPase subunit [Salisediminibacterium beveridgei]